MQIILNLKDGFTFDEANLKTHIDLIEEKAHPYVYDCDVPDVEYIETNLVSMDSIVWASSSDEDESSRIQLPRLANNVKAPAIREDIMTFGFSLANVPILLERLNDGRYLILDGRTRLQTLKEIGVTNIIAGIFEPMSKKDRLIFGVKMNNINKPFGEASFPDIKNAMLTLAKDGHITGDLDSEIVDSVLENLSAMSHKLLPQQQNLIINEVIETKTGVERLRSFPDGKGAKDTLIGMGIVDTPITKNYTISTYIEKTASAIKRKVFMHKDDDVSDVHFYVQGGVLDAKDPVNAWKKGPESFKDRFDDWVADFARAYLRIDINSVSFKNYQSEHSIDDLPQVKIVGAIPQVKSLSNEIPMDKIFKYK